MELRRRGALLLTAALAACSRKSDQPSPTPTPSQPPSSPSPSPATATPSGTATQSATPRPTKSPEPVDVLPTGVVNVLFFGTDSREKSSLLGNTHCLVVAQLSADRRHLTLVSIARDCYVEFAGGGRGKINAAFARGGRSNLVKAVQNLLGGLPIHFTVQTNFPGTIAITRWLGGFEVNNKHATRVKVISTGRVVTFPKGKITLTGTDALIYARERKTMPSGDLDRAQRHRAVLTGMLTKLQQRLAQDPSGFGTLMVSLWGNVKVIGPIDKSKLSGLVPALRAVRDDRVTSLMVPITRFANINGAAVDIVNTTRTAELGAVLRRGDVSGYVKKYGEGYQPTG